MKRRGILVIEANRYLRKEIIWTLQLALREDFELVEVEDRATAIQYLEKQKRPDIILTQVFLPPRPDYLGEGYIALSKFKDIAPEVKTIAITTIDRRDIIEKAGDLRADGYIIKPFKLKELRGVIEKFAKKEAKMKLQATYEKQANASIRATIKVIDSGDFPTINVFKSTSDNPSGEAWNIGEGTESTISSMLPNPEEAKQWVLAKVNAVKRKLDNWRSIWVPESQKFEI